MRKHHQGIELPPTVAVAQMGARMHYAVPRLLQAHERLERFFADICAVQGWPRVFRYLPAAFQPANLRRLMSRYPRDVPGAKLRAFTHFGWQYARRLRSATSRSETTWVHLWAGEQFGRLVSRDDWGGAASIYTFNNAGLEILKEAKRRGLLGIVEQTIAPRETQIRLLREQEQRFPGWTHQYTSDLYADWVIRRQHAEWRQADMIVCASPFVRDCVAECGGPAEKCQVTPYGVDPPRRIPRADPSEFAHRPLRVLTVGAVGLRKGSPYVLAAARELQSVARFRMVGMLHVPARVGNELRQYVEVVGAVPRDQVCGHLQWADVFLLPSICEGSATVVYEALASGLPVICTPNTGSVVRHGTDGWIVPAGDTCCIVECLRRLATDKELLAYQARNARQRATEFDLARYGHRLVQLIDEALGQKRSH